MTAKKSRPAAVKAAKRKVAPAIENDFYGSALSRAECIALRYAKKIEGIDSEIAVLRVKLRTALGENEENLPLMLRGIGLLVKAVPARYRLSKEAEKDLSDSIGGLLRGVGGLLMPDVFDPEPPDDA